MRKHIGNVSVDAGLMWIGDPCYIIHAEKVAKSLGNDWIEFAHGLRGQDFREYSHDSGAGGLGVVVGSFGGDGVYPVYAETNERGRVLRVTVEFEESEV